MTSREDDQLAQTRLRVLERRRRHLLERLERSRGYASEAYDIAEADALGWAIERASSDAEGSVSRPAG